MRQTVGLLGAASFIAIVTLFNPSARPAYAQSSHGYVGESQCENCHDSTHEALKNLIGPDGNPTDPVTVGKAHLAGGAQDDGSMCLKCHATGVGSANPPDPSEGTTCEACHGPAADWVSADPHGHITDDPAKMQAAVALGMITVRDMTIRETNCRTCHVKDTSLRPCYVSTEAPFSVHNDKKFRHWRQKIPD